MSQERRHFHRIHFLTQASLTLAGGQPHPGDIRDLSLKGALLAMPETWRGQAGASCRLEIALDGDDAKIVMEGVLAHVEGALVGLRCQSIDLDSISHLRRLVELNLGDSALLDRELSALVSGD